LLFWVLTKLNKCLLYPPLSQILSLLFGLVVSASSVSTNLPPIPIEEWEAQAGDRFIADTKENMGYLVHEDGRYAVVTIASGRKKIVRYIGRTYDATTPIARWNVQTKHIQGDRVTFGKSGRFLRLYWNDAYTSYGIHSHAYIKKILASDDRFQSMGCILVDDAVMDILYETFELNGQSLDVVTTYGLDHSLFAKTEL